MATTDLESHVEEQPATHKAELQRWAIIILAILFVVFMVATLWQMWAPKPQVAPSAPPHQPAASERRDSVAAFDEMIAQRQAEVARQRARETAVREHKAQAARRLEASLPAVASEAPYSGANLKPRSTASRLPGARAASPEEQWLQQEQQRVRASRTAGFGFSLPSDAEQQATPAALTTAQTTAFRPFESTTLDARQAEVQRRIEEVRQLRERLQRGDADASQAIRQLAAQRSGTAGGGVGIPLPSAHGEAGQGGAQPAALPDSIVGLTQSRAEEAGISPAEAGMKRIVPTTVIKAALQQKIMSDYTGSFTALLTHDVYDFDYENVLLPRGTRLQCESVRITNVNEPIQARMGYLVKGAILPTGDRVDLSRSSGLDREGVGAVKDKVDRHFIAQFMGVAAYALIADETEGNRSSELLGETDYEADVNEGLREQFRPMAERYLSVVPTITLRKGTPLAIYIEEEVWVKPHRSIYDSFY